MRDVQWAGVRLRPAHPPLRLRPPHAAGLEELLAKCFDYISPQLLPMPAMTFGNPEMHLTGWVVFTRLSDGITICAALSLGSCIPVKFCTIVSD